jgi:hypothetical protein
VQPAELVVLAVKGTPLATDDGDTVMHASSAVPLPPEIENEPPYPPDSCGSNCTDCPDVNVSGVGTTVVVFTR